MKKLKRWVLTHLNGYDIPRIIKPKPLATKPTDRICVLAPHSDDEAIGCGGLLARFAKQSDVVILTDGGAAGNPTVRQKESEEAMRFLGVSRVAFLNAGDGRLIEAYDLFRTWDFTPYDYVFMPHKNDGHRDHVVPQAFFKRLKKENKNVHAKAVYYEVWSTLAAPTHYLDISNVVDKKRQAIELYRSQQNIPYADRILGLNHYRGMRAQIPYAEAFEMGE